MSRLRTASYLFLLPMLGLAPVATAELAPVPTGDFGTSIPLAFEENRGQTDAAVSFLARGSGYGIFLADGEIVFVLHDRPVTALASADGASIVRLQFAGGNRDAVAEGLGRLPGSSYYFQGSDPKQWTSGVSNFERVLVRDIYPGIDILCYGNQRQLEYDFIVHPGADLSQIRLRVVGGEARIEHPSGDLTVATARGVFRQKLPHTFEQTVAGRDASRRPIASSYRIDDSGDIRFVVAEHRRDRILVIDPVVHYSTYHGGAEEDSGFGIAADSDGNAYVTGYTASLNFPTQSPFQAMNATIPDIVNGYYNDAFVSKFSSDGSTLIYSTYFGGSNEDLGIAIALDASNSAYVTGRTNSINFPATGGAYQGTNGGAAGVFDAFVFKLDANGALAYSTYLGGDNDDRGEGIAVDAMGRAFVAGITSSLTDFPTAVPGPGIIDSIGPVAGIDGFVLRLNAGGSALDYSLRIGGSLGDSTEAVKLDADGNAYVAGHSTSPDFPTVAAFQPVKSDRGDATAYKVNATGTALLYSTFLGGSGDDLALAVETDAAGNAYYAGKTNSPYVAATAQYPTSPGAHQTTNAGPAGSNDAFVTKLTPSGTLSYSTLIGNPNPSEELAYGVGVDSNGNATIAGETTVIGDSDVFLAKLNNTGTILVYALLFRGSLNDYGRDLDFDADGYAYVTGFTLSSDFSRLGAMPPGTLENARQPANAGASDAFVIKFTDSVDLRVTKTDGQTSDTPATSISYTITVTNPGPFEAVGATVTDIFPAALSNVTWTAAFAGGATGTAAGAGNINETVTVPIGGSITYTVLADISPAASGTLSNTATVTAADTVIDLETTNNGATDTTLLGAEVNLAITKTDGVSTVTAGEAVTYTIVVSNSGPSNAVGATVTDTFPVALVGVTYTSTAAGGATGNTAGAGNISDTVNLPVGSSITYTASGTVSPGATGTLVNTATVGAPAGASDPVPGDNSATDTDTIGVESDLAITKTDGQTNALPGQVITYTIVVSSSGPSTAVGATVADLFPPELTGVTYTSIPAGGATGNTAVGSGNINDVVTLPPGSSITYTATGTLSPSATGTLSNTATVTAPGGLNDPDPANNSATDTNTLEAEADLSVTKTDSPDPVAPNATITYAISVANAGPSDASTVVLTDILPVGTTFASLVQDSGPVFICVAPAPSTSGTVTCTIATLASGGSAAFTLVVNVAGGAAGSTITNTASIATATLDDNAVNDSATTTTTVLGGPNVLATKDVTSDSQFATGTQITYTIVLTNEGDTTQGDNPGDELTDVLPPGLVLVSASSDSGTTTVDIPGNTVHFNGVLLPNVPVTITIIATITATSGPISNQATIFYDPNADGINDATRLSDDATFIGDEDPTVFTIGGGPSVLEIPTLHHFALLFLALMLGGAALMILRR